MILGFDFGLKYIGVASGQLLTKTATPLTCLRATDGIPNWDEVQTLITNWRPDTIIVGLPLNMDDSTQYLTNCAKKFGHRLEQKFKIPVQFVDERLSTWEAKQTTLSRTTKLNTQLTAINSKAAAIILEQWLNQQ